MSDMLVQIPQKIESDILQDLLSGLEMVPVVVQDDKNTIIEAKTTNDYEELLCRTRAVRQKRMEERCVFTQEARDEFIANLLKKGHDLFEKNLTSMSIYKISDFAKDIGETLKVGEKYIPLHFHYLELLFIGMLAH